jgi:NAD(P)-dependent dehydrogenase (short-subunit alcohol dehydrogenase family)
MRSQQKVAVVTGAGSGIGAAAAAAAARLLARKGAPVVLADLHTDGGEAVEQAIPSRVARRRFNRLTSPTSGASRRSTRGALAKNPTTQRSTHVQRNS